MNYPQNQGKGYVKDLTTNNITVNTGITYGTNVAPVTRFASASVVLADFTDGTGTSGSVTTSINIPIGAVVKQAYIKGVTGFIGDTSAVLTIGDGTDPDRYNTGTPSVFTTADFIDAGVTSGTAFHATAKDVILTVTGNADFTSITAGGVTVVIEYTESA